VWVFGAGMAGLCAAARARELGAAPLVLEKGSRAGGSMLLSSGVVWRYRSFDEFRAQCPDGDERLQRLVFDGLDEPFADSSAIPTYLVSRATRRHVTVALSGDGGDEVFGGYRKYQGELLAERYRAVPAPLRRGVIEPLVNLLPESKRHPLMEKARRLRRFVFPAFVKPVCEESSDGISRASFVRDEGEALERARFVHQKFECDALIEEYIEGRELYVSVLGNNRLQVFPPREIFFEQVPEDIPKFATFHAKWNRAYRKKWGIKNGAAKQLPEGVEDHLKKLSRKVYGLLKIRGFGRIDVRLTPNGEVYVIEANPNPSLAEDEDFAQSAANAGIGYDALIQEILDEAFA